MLEVATIHRIRNHAGDNFPIGEILDIGLYYGTVHLVLDDFEISGLIRAIGAEGLIRILNSSTFKVTILNSATSVAMIGRGAQQFYRPMAWHIDPTKDKKAPKGPEHTLFRHFNIPGTTSEMTLPEAKTIVAKAKVTDFPALVGAEYDTNINWHSLVADHSVVRDAIRLVARREGYALDEPTLAKVRFAFDPLEDGITAWSSTRLDKIATTDGERQITWMDVLGVIERYRTDVHIASSLGGDFVVDEVAVGFAARRAETMLQRVLNRRANIDAFQRATFSSGRSIGVTFEAGDISLDTALGLIDDAAKFKEWIAKLPADSNLINEYIRELGKKPLLEKFPGRELTFGILSAANVALGVALTGPAGAAAGLGLSAFETYLLGRFVKGWRPNEFVAQVQAKLSPQ